MPLNTNHQTKHPGDTGSPPSRMVCAATPQKRPDERDNGLKVPIWPQDSPDPNLMEHPWDVPEK